MEFQASWPTKYVGFCLKDPTFSKGLETLQLKLHTLAPKRSVVFFSVSLINMTEGIKIQTTLPMVEPTRLRTFSMSGVLIPTTKVIRRIPTVIPWDLKEMQKCMYLKTGSGGNSQNKSSFRIETGNLKIAHYYTF